ncbi:TorD/DmsD family molecular chaperone [Gordonibacter massiliensis (ex Traore et al. 2017)]|uniref:Molecular chaperone TorD family protein n=1 Tax=Gordonibacter massiliensis (ex Traore et al. 2017) TaxID=1841863 RepID=A0A842JAL1_9ACTN|nr:molecular chaperone TorD family protein [Gordonibacter massiliensis (ex Traore et al. 2017)]MBC2887836.1 molecular chaperone TorD family protein [Gordonibacter massiliensis (ex Traore et al. 2017)]
MAIDEAVALLLANRHFLYAYLSRAFAAEPDEAFLDVVADAHTKDECALLDDEREEGTTLQRGLAALATEGPDALERLRSEYTKLLIGPGKLPAPPWESVFVSGEPLLFQKSTLAVREAYRAAGFQAAGYPHEADDHLAIELAFMEALADRMGEAYAADDGSRVGELARIQLDFLRNHLLVWVGSFADRLLSYGKVSSFYPSFAALAALVCARDVDVLAELLSLE